MKNKNMIDDILSNLKNGYSVHNIEDFIKERYDINFIIIVNENEIYQKIN